MAASESFSIFIFNNYDISEINIKYVDTRNLFNNFQGTENIQNQLFRSILKDFEIFTGNIYGGDCFHKKISVTAFLKLY